MKEQLTETAQQQGELWSEAGQDWSEQFAPLLSPVWGACHDLAKVSKGIQLLDVGCGSGEALAMARLRGAEVHGLDAAPRLVEIAAERMPQADFRCGDMENLPYEDESFDAITHINSIMYSDDPPRAIREARRVLTQDGHLAMAVWAEPEVCEFRHIMAALKGLLPNPPKGDGPFTLSGPGALEEVMRASRLEPVGLREVHTPFVFLDETHYLRAIKGTGPGQAVLKQAGDEAVTKALLDVGKQFIEDDGAYYLDNTFRVVAATPMRSEDQ